MSADEVIGLRVGDVRLEVPRSAVYVGPKGAAYLKGRKVLTWCEDERRGVDCGENYAEGVGRDGCPFGHIVDEKIRGEVEARVGRLQEGGGKGKKSGILDEIVTPECYSLEEYLTVVITTSPTRSNPETMLIEAVLSTFSQVAGLEKCHLVVVCDGCDVHEESTAKEKLGFKRGVVTKKSSADYETYKRNLKKLLNNSSDTRKVTFMEKPTREGFGWAVRTAISQKVRTPYTMVIQHDRYFERGFDIDGVLHAMRTDPRFKVVYMLNSSMKNHYWRVRNRAPTVDWTHPATAPVAVSDTLTLNPCFAWLDSTHIAETAHLIKFVFGMRGKAAESGVPIRKGDFPEDRLNQAQMKSLREDGPVSHKRYGTWVMAAGKIQVRHLSGRNFESEGTSGARARFILGLSDDEEEDDSDP